MSEKNENFRFNQTKPKVCGLKFHADYKLLELSIDQRRLLDLHRKLTGSKVLPFSICFYISFLRVKMSFGQRVTVKLQRFRTVKVKSVF